MDLHFKNCLFLITSEHVSIQISVIKKKFRNMSLPNSKKGALLYSFFAFTH